MDNSLAALAVQAKSRLEAGELIDLTAGAKALFNLVTLLCREKARIEDCARLWEETRNCFVTA
jgi:hypothetical protein